MKKIIFMMTLFSVLLVPFFLFSAEVEKVSAKSYCVIEASTGIVLSSFHSDEQLPEASTTKIMTALIAIETMPLDAETTVSVRAANVEGSGIGLCEGDKVCLSDLLYMLMLKSGNDAAVAVAECVAGSVEDFVLLMNEKARQLGCDSTHFTNPHGLPDDDHYTTAHDLCVIAAEAYKNAEFRKIVSSETAKLSWHNLVIRNSNKLLSTVDGVNGMKTGFTKKAGRCLVSSAERDGISVICVTLSDPDDWNDHENLLNDAFSRISKKLLYDVGEYRAEVPSLGGNKPVTVTNAEPIYGIMADGQTLPYDFTENLPVCMFAPVEKGKIAGRVILSCNGNPTASVPLEVCESVACSEQEETFFGRITRFFSFLFGRH